MSRVDGTIQGGDDRDRPGPTAAPVYRRRGQVAQGSVLVPRRRGNHGTHQCDSSTEFRASLCCQGGSSALLSTQAALHVREPAVEPVGPISPGAAVASPSGA